MTAATEPSTASGSATSGSGTRKSVPLTAQDLVDLAVVRSERSALGRSLTQLSGVDPHDSDAAVLHGLVALGLQRIREAAEKPATPNSPTATRPIRTSAPNARAAVATAHAEPAREPSITLSQPTMRAVDAGLEAALGVT